MERLWPCMKEDSGEELCLLDEDTFLYSAEVEKLLMCPTFAVSLHSSPVSVFCSKHIFIAQLETQATLATAKVRWRETSLD